MPIDVFIIELTGSKTKQGLVDKYGAGAVFVKDQPGPAVRS
jgi:hypothetical protein